MVHLDIYYIFDIDYNELKGGLKLLCQNVIIMNMLLLDTT